MKAALTEATAGKAVSVPIDKAVRLLGQILSAWVLTRRRSQFARALKPPSPRRVLRG